MADFYGDVAGYKTYHDARGNTYTDNATAIGAALYRGSVTVDGIGFEDCKGSVRALWPGTKAGGRAQLRQWPRIDAVDNEGNAVDSASVPIEVVYATYEAALREQIAPGSTSPDYVAAQQIKREKIDVIETEYATPATGTVADLRPVLSVVMDLLRPLLRTSASDFAVLVL